MCFGPSSFEAYALLRFIPDPTQAGQSEKEAVPIPGVRVDVPNRSLFQFEGSLPPSASWGTAQDHQAPGRQRPPEPAFIWAADHTWCIANDAAPQWAGIGITAQAVQSLMADGHFDIVLADPAPDHPG